MTEGNFATLGFRGVAFILDSLMIGLIYFAVALGLGLPTEGAMQNYLAGGLGFSVLLYFVIGEGKYGQTLGKKIVNIKVVGKDMQNPPGLLRAFARYVLRIVDWFPFLYVIGSVAIFVTEDNQRVGDLVGGTYVVNTVDRG